MMKWPLRKANLLYRDPNQDQDAAAILKGDVYEFTDPPFHEVDPVTRKTKSALQCFRVIDNTGGMRPVRRLSWLA